MRAESSDEPVKFTLPRGLLCGRSSYFDRAFRSGFVEADNGSIELTGVDPTIFRCFVSWMYTQRIYYDPGDLDPSTLSTLAKSCSGRPKTSIAEDAPHMPPLGPNAYDRLARVLTTHTSGLSNASPVPRPLRGSSKADTDCESSNSSKSVETEEVSSQYLKSHSDILSKYSSGDYDCDDPATWSWSDLTRLYIFGEEYETRDFRTAVMELMQEEPNSEPLRASFSRPQVCQISI